LIQVVCFREYQCSTDPSVEVLLLDLRSYLEVEDTRSMTLVPVKYSLKAPTLEGSFDQLEKRGVDGALQIGMHGLL
jgi:hypothetical protein